MKHVFLDSYPLSLASHSAATPEVIGLRNWAISLLTAGHKIYVAEVIDYELRRELLRAGKVNSLAILDSLKTSFRYVPITTDTMLHAARLWAQARNSGFSTGDPKKLDIDVILAAQAHTHTAALGVSTSDLIVATSNVAHLSHFVPATLWSHITP